MTDIFNIIVAERVRFVSNSAREKEEKIISGKFFERKRNKKKIGGKFLKENWRKNIPYDQFLVNFPK